MVEIPDSIHGACTRQQALNSLGQYGLRVAILRRELTPLWRGVLVDPRRLLESPTRAAAALLAVGQDAVLCGPTALTLHGCTAAEEPTVHLMLRYDRWARRQVGLRVHHGRLTDDDVVRLRGLPVVALDLAVADALCIAPRRRALAWADQAVALHLLGEREDFLTRVAVRLGGRTDRRGTRRAVGLLALIDGAAESPPESHLRLIVVDAGLPVPVAQHPIRTPDGLQLWRLDLAWPELKIALEYDGYETHAGRDLPDRARDEDLRRRGWIVVHADAADLRNPQALLDRLAEAFATRRMSVERLRRAV
jgi:hypothetical protein